MADGLIDALKTQKEKWVEDGQQISLAIKRQKRTGEKMIATQNEPSFTSRGFDIGASATATGVPSISTFVGKFLLHSAADDQFIFEHPIPVIVEAGDNCYVATFAEANIGCSGDRAGEALFGLASLLIDVFSFLTANESQLGPDPQRQLRVLRQYIARQDA